MTTEQPDRTAYADQPGAADLRRQARTTGARLRWDRITHRTPDAGPEPRTATTPEVSPDAVRLADGLEQHLD